MNTLEAVTTDAQETPRSTRIQEVDGIDFRLGDGQSWSLAAPGMRLYPRFVALPIHEDFPTGPSRVECQVEQRWGYPPTLERLANEFIEAVYSDDAETDIDYRAILELAYHLIKRCHKVSDLALHEALSISPANAQRLGAGMLRMFRGLPPFDPAPEEPATIPEEPQIPAKE